MPGYDGPDWNISLSSTSVCADFLNNRSCLSEEGDWWHLPLLCHGRRDLFLYPDAAGRVAVCFEKTDYFSAPELPSPSACDQGWRKVTRDLLHFGKWMPLSNLKEKKKSPNISLPPVERLLHNWVMSSDPLVMTRDHFTRLHLCITLYSERYHCKALFFWI